MQETFLVPASSGLGPNCDVPPLVVATSLVIYNKTITPFAASQSVETQTMDSKAKQALIKALSRASIIGHPIAIKHKDKSLALVLPIKDYQKFQAEREEKLKLMKKEYDGILALIRRYTGHQSLEEVEAQLAALRQQIEEEGE